MALTGAGGYAGHALCPQCMGAGDVIRVGCKKCNGEGKVKGIRKVDITIPPGVADGARFMMSGKGDAGRMLWPSGDLVITVTAGAHPFFRRKGNDIYCHAPVPFTIATLGGHITVPTINKDVEMTIPPGSASRTTFRLKGRGINGKGHQYVRLIVNVPSRLTAKEKRILEAFAKLRGDLAPDKKLNVKGRLKKVLGFGR